MSEISNDSTQKQDQSVDYQPIITSAYNALSANIQHSLQNLAAAIERDLKNQFATLLNIFEKKS